MAVSLNEAVRRLLDDPNPAVLATINADGSPQTSVIWVGREGDELVISSAAGRRKDVNIRRDPRVSLSVYDQRDSEVYAEIRGRATVTEDIGRALAVRLAEEYAGPGAGENYLALPPEIVRVVIRIVPEHVAGAVMRTLSPACGRPPGSAVLPVTFLSPTGGHMLRKSLKVAALAGAGAVALALAAPGPAHAASGGWQVAGRVTGLGDAPYIWAVTAAGAGSEWAFGDYANSNGSFALERTGSTWKRVPFPGNGHVTVARASSASDVWAFGLSGAVHWNGSKWVAAGSDAVISDAIVFGPADVWAFSNDGGISRYNGRSWSPLAGSSGLVSGNALSPTSVWAGGGSVVAHWNGRSWTRTSVAKLIPDSAPVAVVYAASADSVYAITGTTEPGQSSYLLHWNGRAWSRAATIPDGVFGPGDLTGDGSGGIWVDSLSAGIMHYSHGRLTTARLPISGIAIKSLARIPGTADILAGGVVIHKNATTQAAVLEYTP